MHSVALLALLSAIVAGSPVARQGGLAPLFKPKGEIVPDKYIVKLKDGVSTASLDDSLTAIVGDNKQVYQHLFAGFSGHFHADAIAKLRSHPDVEFIEHDRILKIASFTKNDDAAAPWNLARISHRKPGATTYDYDKSAGEGTCSYVIDTGVDDSHPDFGGRAKQIKTFVEGDKDGNGHGTHMAGIVGSTSFGVARKTQIFGVKALGDDGSGQTSAFISSMDFVAKDYKTRKCPKGAVASISVAGAKSDAVNAGAAALVKAGVFVAAVAGGDAADAGQNSPGSEPTVCTAGASDKSDTIAQFSNFGSLVDIFAPAKDIESTWIKGEKQTISGITAAAAHIAGLGAYIAALEGITGGQKICDRLKELATKDALKKVPKGTANLLAFNGNKSG